MPEPPPVPVAGAGLDIRGARLKVIPATGHLATVEAADAVTRTLLSTAVSTSVSGARAATGCSGALGSQR
jgi:pimeloyl-ACP methyl ester carboxylesterase